ncbi:Protein tyrosine phosphatase [Saccharomyces pastorianus]|uniref:protein-tyrosine-phosphatase n=1 Tax=Saccharomyces pastorianus TaxID=27292 RepID=A0A6C1EEL3_SACPS|nr:Protein tyrosine phosphatase [Saccharomyces pastorianus]
MQLHSNKQRLDSKSDIDFRSKSPRSLQNRNTKNLSLDIATLHPLMEFSLQSQNDPGSVKFPSPTPLNLSMKPKTTILEKFPTKISSRPIPPPLPLRRSEASIYTLPASLKSRTVSPNLYTRTSMATSIGKHSLSSPASSFSEKPHLNRVHSLSVKTKDLRLKGIRGRSQTISGLEASTPTSSIYETALGNSDLNKFSNQKNMQTTLIFPEEEPDLNIDKIHTEIYQRTVYLDGPLLVIPSSLYLYSEPKLEDILSFDLVINVAKEIPNLKLLLPPEVAHKIQYHHVEWTHTSKIVSDLSRLTRIMHTAYLQGKKILVHCQCGVSRSASLIVAYIMRYYGLTLNDAYNKLKMVAKDISPNMGLIFQLMEWGEMLSKNSLEEEGEAIRMQPEEDETSNNEASSSTAKSYSSVSYRSFPMLMNPSSSPNDSSINSSEVTPRTPATLTGARTTLVEEQDEEDKKRLSQTADALDPSVDSESLSTASEQMMLLP